MRTCPSFIEDRMRSLRLGNMKRPAEWLLPFGGSLCYFFATGIDL